MHRHHPTDLRLLFSDDDSFSIIDVREDIHIWLGPIRGAQHPKIEDALCQRAGCGRKSQSRHQCSPLQRRYNKISSSMQAPARSPPLSARLQQGGFKEDVVNERPQTPDLEREYPGFVYKTKESGHKTFDYFVGMKRKSRLTGGSPLCTTSKAVLRSQSPEVDLNLYS